MRLKSKSFLLALLIGLSGLCLAGCNDDKDEPGSGSSLKGLTVNGVAWDIAGSAPNYGEWSFSYWGQPQGSNRVFLMLWEEDLNDVEVGDEVTCNLAFPAEDLAYTCTDGEITVVKVSGGRVTLKFDDVEYRYKGSYTGYASSDRDTKYQPNTLTIDGTVEFMRN